MKKANKKINAAIVIIGNEILSGRTQDINVSFLAKWLNEQGVYVGEVRIIEDNEEAIINCIKEIKSSFKYIFTTGGIGPTHDDITSKSIAKAFNLSCGYHKEAYDILEKYYDPGQFNEGRKKMAKIPDQAELIYNPSSGAPGFIIENVFCLPGVPSILKSMIGGLKNKIIGGKKILSKTISISTVESEIAKPLEDIQNKFTNIEIGSYPFFKLGKVGVSIVMRSTEKDKIDDCSKQIISFIQRKKIQIVESG
uniref:Competence/damage-inducible protein CinA n=1 Tax=uncultured Alphaproteobacteria bacterium TaxID=91750 RepID=A0A1B0Z1M0_9PROT|nr:competence/damage-inducible protein CinA [uncultured Alphaproteobacteria bacterium]